MSIRVRSLLTSLGAAALACLLSVPGAARADVIFVAGSGNEFGTLDLTTGAFAQIGTLALPADDNIYGMGFGSNGLLYGLDSQSVAHLWTIDVSNANVADLGSIGQSAIGATADGRGKLYALSNDLNGLYYTMNPPSTTTDVVAPTGIAGTGLAAVTPDGSALYATGQDPTDPTQTALFGIDTGTGNATFLGDTLFPVLSGLFVGTTLYGFDPSGRILTIDTVTGTGTPVGTYTLPNGDSIFAAAPGIPEPGALALLATGVLSLLGRTWWKRKPAAS